MRKLLFPLLSILLFTACQKQVITDKASEESGGAVANKEDKIEVCHKTGNGSWHTINISVNAWPAHQAHGDVRLDDQDDDGYVPTNACGFGTQGDCNDNPALGGTAINPGATEICNNIDDNCNGQVDENCIPSVTICNQVWMLNNLDVSKYRNGEDIPQVTDATDWFNLTTGAWCWYENNSTNGTTYGKLYNWYAVNDSRGLAPAGWHIASHAEWTVFSDCLGGELVAGGKMKSITHWAAPNTDATNSSGFTGLPGAYRTVDGLFDDLGYYGNWWTSTELDAPHAWYRTLGYNYGEINKSVYGKEGGHSVRCIRD